LTEPDQTLTTSQIANQPADDADAPMSREQQTDGAGDAATGEPEVTPLLSGEQSQDFNSRWSEIQTGFVDEPHTAVQNADQLVAELMQSLAASFAETRAGLEQQWARGDDVSTEDLRVALTRYRSFFQRLLAA
jgi:hypothetical protein